MSGSSPANHNIRNNKACDEWLLTCKLQYQGTHVQRGQWLHAYKSKFSYKKTEFSIKIKKLIHTGTVLVDSVSDPGSELDPFTMVFQIRIMFEI